jgi:hypothetical protein
MKNDAAIIMIIFLAVMLASLIKWNVIFKSTKSGTQAIQSTGDPLMDQVYRDYPELDPRR